MSWLRLTLVAFSSMMLLILVLLGVLLFTSAGNQLIWQQLKASMPTLQGELVDGHLGRGLRLHGLRYDSPALEIQADDLTFDWRLASLLSGRLIIDDLVLSNGSLIYRSDAANDAPDEPEPTTQSGEADSLIYLPLDLQLKQLTVARLRIATPDVVVGVAQLQASASWQGTQLRLISSQSSDVDVQLLPSVPDPDAKPERPSAKPEALLREPFNEQKVRQQIETLPTVFFPFDLTVEQFAVQRARYHQVGFDTGLFDVSLQGQFVGTELTVDALDVAHSFGGLALQGTMSFVDYYPMQVTLKGLSKVDWLDKQLHGRRATLQVAGPLTDLQGKLGLDGKEGAELKLRLNTLAPDLPFETSLIWKQLQWPLRGEPDLRLLNGKLSASGHLSAYQMTLHSQSEILDLPHAKLDLSLKGSLQGVEIKPLSLTSPDGALALTGKLDWQRGVHWLGNLELKSGNLNSWLPELSGRIGAKLATEFVYRAPHWQLKIPSMQANGQLNGYPLALSGRLSGDDQQMWRFENIRLNSGSNRMLLDGALGRNWQARASLDATDLGLLHPELQGAVKAQFDLSGSAKQPVVKGQLQSERLILSGVRMHDLQAQGALTMGRIWQGDLQMSLGRLRSGSTRIQDLLLSLKGSEESHDLRLSFAGNPLASELRLHGQWRGKRWQGELSSGHFDTLIGRWQLDAPLSISVAASMRQVALGAQCWRSDDASLCLKAAELSGEQGDLDLALTQFATQKLRPLFPERMDWIATLGLEGRVGWRRGIPHANLALISEPGQLIADKFVSAYDKLSLSTSLDEQQGAVVLHFASRQLGRADINLLISDPMGERTLGGELAIHDLRLYSLAPLMDELKNTRGRINANGRMAGTLAKPLFYGKVTLQEGIIETSAELAKITDLSSELLIDGASARLSGRMKVGKGTMELTGRVSWAGDVPDGSITLLADTLEVGLAGYGRARVSSNLVLLFGQEIRLTGQVRIPWARILVKSLPDSAVSVSDDVEIVTKRRAAQPAKRVQLPIWLDLSVGLGGDVRLDALGLKTKLVGGLRLVQNPQVPLRADGVISLDDGRFKSFGQNLLIREGKLQFSGNPAAPYLLVKAERDPETMEDKDITVGVKVTGPVAQPKIEIYSEPQLAESEKLSYLLRGKSSTSSGTTSNDEAMTGILLGAGLSQANGVVSDIAETFGFSDVSLDSSGSGDETQVSISGYLMPGLQLQYGMGVFTSISEVRLRYELMPRLYVQVMSGLNQALDLFYKFEF